MLKFDQTIRSAAESLIADVETELAGDFAYYFGHIDTGLIQTFSDFIEQVEGDGSTERLILVLNTPGGSVEAAERYVEIMRFHFEEVYFVVPRFAMSAGTVLCMSGDKIFMDYTSSLGPVDPQVFKNGQWVPALGYLDKVEEMIQRSRDGELTAAEYASFRELDLAELRMYEQARDLTGTLLRDWLRDYKFKSWTTHKSDGRLVTSEERENRAAEVAKLLGDHKHWNSHGRLIGIDKLKTTLKLEIEDYSQNGTLRDKIRSYTEIIEDYIRRYNYPVFLNSRTYF